MPRRKPQTPSNKPPPGFRATGPNAPFHYKAEDFHFRGPAKFDTRALGIEDLPEPSDTETARSPDKSEHVQFDKNPNEVYEIGIEVEEYLDRPNPHKVVRAGRRKQQPGVAPPGR
ncbi:hypothetical protein AAVH_04986 [Aphelenchoides avenae]|nr:hypothetical protein AAVH_04986 [Aphelenchus avenae]